MKRIFSDKLAGSGAFNAAVKVLGIGLSFVFMKATTQISGAEGWGLFTIAYTVALLCVSVARLGVDTALLKTIGQAAALGQYHRLGSALRQATLAVLAVATALAAGLWMAAPLLAELMHKTQVNLGPFLRIAALWIPFWAPLFLFTESLRGFGRTALYVFLQAGLPYLIGLAGMVFILWQDIPAYSADAALVCYGFGLVFSATIAFGVLRYVFHKARTQPERARFPIRTLQKTALPILSTYLLVTALGMVDVLLLGYFEADAAETGIYALALRLSNLMLMPVQALGGVTAAALAGLYVKGRQRELAHTLRRTGKLIRLGTVPMWIGLCALSWWVMGFFGHRFESGWLILCILAFNQLFNALCGPIDVLLQMTGRERVYRNLIALALGVNVVLNLILIPRYGMYGAAAAHTATILTWNLVGVWRIYKLYGIWLLRVW